MSRVLGRPLRHLTFSAGLGITALLLLTAALSLGYTPRDPLEMSMEARLQGPSRSHPLGTDQFGRDLLSRIMVGSETSILVGVIAVGIGMGLGYAAATPAAVAIRAVQPLSAMPGTVAVTAYACESVGGG